MENDINKSIYQQMIDYAHKLVDEGRIKIKLDGSFTTAEMARNYIIGECKVKETIWEVADESLNAEGATISAGNFTCHFLPDKIFELAYAFQSEAKIGRKDYEHFSKQTEEEPIICEFTVPKDIGTLVKATANDELRPQLCGVYLDTDRRCLVASDGGVLRAVSLPDLNMWQPLPKKKYTEHSGKEPLNIILNRKLIKPGAHITVTATKADDGKQWENNIEGTFPRWMSVMPHVDSNNRINIKGCIAELKSIIKGAQVESAVIKGTEGYTHLTVLPYDEYFKEDYTGEHDLNLPEPCPFSFTIRVNAKHINSLNNDTDSLYLTENDHIILFSSPGIATIVAPMKIKLQRDDFYTTWKVEPKERRDVLDLIGFNTKPADNPKLSPKKSEPKRNGPKQDEAPVFKQSLTTEAMWLHYAGLFFIFFNFTKDMIIGHIDINGDHVPIYDTIPEGWGIITGAANAPGGYRWINNRQPIFGKGYRHALVAV